MKKLILPSLLSLASLTTVNATLFNGNGLTGFGDVIGNGSLELTDNGTTLSGTITRGASNFNDAVVIYIDSVAGGFTGTGGMSDTADKLRSSISYGTGGAINFTSGFQADYAIALAPNGPTNDINFGGLWQLDATSHSFVQSVNLNSSPNTGSDPGGVPGDATFTFDFDFSEIGLGGPSSFNFVAVYMNPDNQFLSNEAIGVTGGFTGANPGSDATVSLEGSATYVPEPGSYALLLGLSAVSFVIIRRKR